MRFDIITIFPHMFDSYLNESILKRAQKNKLIEIKIHNLRDFLKNKNKDRVDDKAYGGGPGMVLKVEPIIQAVNSILDSKPKTLTSLKNQNSRSKKTKIILFSAAGKQFDNKIAIKFAKNYDHLILICGRYEGIDERVKKIIKNSRLEIENLSIGPYVLTGGELPAMILIDAVSRQIPGVLGRSESLEEKRYGVGVPVYTRPAILEWPLSKKSKKSKNYKVPKVLLSGNHKKIDEWRIKNSKNTLTRS